MSNSTTPPIYTHTYTYSLSLLYSGLNTIKPPTPVSCTAGLLPGGQPPDPPEQFQGPESLRTLLIPFIVVTCVVVPHIVRLVRLSLRFELFEPPIDGGRS